MPRYHFTEEQLDNYAERYRQGETFSALASALDCSSQTIQRLLSNRVETRSASSRGRYADADKRRMVERYEAGESLAGIARDYGCAAGNVRFILLRRGVTLRRTGRPAIPQDRLEWVKAQRSAGATLKQLGDELGIKAHTVSAMCRALGLAPDPRMRGAAHHAWKGGRVKHYSGYVMVFVDPDDPLFTMATGLGYVPEHRLVMARSLGRPLHGGETVHHINGDKKDNRLENLQLRQGNHGKGSVMQCLDCGSHNLGHEPLL